MSLPCLLGSLVCFCLPVMAADVDSHYSASVAGSGGLLESWIENPARSWDNLVVCGRYTNRSNAPQTAEFAFQPPFWVTAADRHGNPLIPAPHSSRYFTAPNTIRFSSVDREIPPGESVTTRIPFTEAFRVDGPGEARITMSWNPQLVDGIKLELTNELRLPAAPIIIAPPSEPRRDKTPAITDHQAADTATNHAALASSPSKPPSAAASDQSWPLNEAMRPTLSWLAWAVVFLSVLGLLWLKFKKRR